MTDMDLQQRIEKLEEENRLLRRTIKIHEEQMKRGGFDQENRRLRAKLAEWEGSSTLMNGGYYHGPRFISPYRDEGEQWAQLEAMKSGGNHSDC